MAKTRFSREEILSDLTRLIKEFFPDRSDRLIPELEDRLSSRCPHCGGFYRITVKKDSYCRSCVVKIEKAKWKLALRSRKRAEKEAKKVHLADELCVSCKHPESIHLPDGCGHASGDSKETVFCDCPEFQADTAAAYEAPKIWGYQKSESLEAPCTCHYPEYRYDADCERHGASAKSIDEAEQADGEWNADVELPVRSYREDDEGEDPQ